MTGHLFVFFLYTLCSSISVLLSDLFVASMGCLFWQTGLAEDYSGHPIVSAVYLDPRPETARWEVWSES